MTCSLKSPYSRNPILTGKTRNVPLTSPSPDFGQFWCKINSIRPLGRIEEDYSAKFVIGGRAWGTLRYQNGYLQTAELIGHAPPLPIAFTHTCTL
jgi:hypothetical protein